ncbi:MAG: DUF308 domain-containing protein [Acetatifactor sp.]|nr:DUF308 domain-containing protein [Acetatifactor sp.]
MHSVKPIQTAKTGYIVVSVLFCVMGITLICMPEFIVPLIGKILGIFLILFGLVKLIGYFSKDLFRLTFQYDLALGILLIALGVIMIIRADNVMVFVSVAHGIYAMADSLLKIQTSLDARHFGIRSWWLILAAAVCTGIIGFLLVLRPFQGADILIILSGCSLLAEGILNLVTVMTTVKIIRQAQPDEIEG